MCDFLKFIKAAKEIQRLFKLRIKNQEDRIKNLEARK